jgi:hypothetical protein
MATMNAGPVAALRPRTQAGTLWAREVIQISASLGLFAHAYVWWRAYSHAVSPAPEAWVDPRLIAAPFILGLVVLVSAFRRRTWACLVLTGATWVGLIGALTWLAGALTGEDVLRATSVNNAVDRSVFLLLPALVAIPLTAACARLGMLSAPDTGSADAVSESPSA